MIAKLRTPVSPCLHLSNFKYDEQLFTLFHQTLWEFVAIAPDLVCAFHAFSALQKLATHYLPGKDLAMVHAPVS